MPDLSASWDIPNAYGLVSADFAHDLDSYRVALGFLGDLVSGSDHDYALINNGGSLAQLRAWQGSEKFRRVYGKCRVAGAAEQEALRARESAPTTTDDEGADVPSGQTFVPLEALPAQRSPFSLWPSAGTFGGE